MTNLLFPLFYSGRVGRRIRTVLPLFAHVMCRACIVGMAAQATAQDWMSEPILTGMTNPSAKTARARDLLRSQRFGLAVQILRDAVESERDPDAQYLLGWCYANGRGVPRSLLQAEQAFFGAAERNQPAAQYSLGRLRIDTAQPGNNKRVLSGLDSLKGAADQGMEAAMRMLGMLYRKGLPGFLEPDISEALNWLGKAAAAGDATALFLQAAMTESGEIGKADGVRALALYNEAAANGSSDAMVYLGDKAMGAAPPDRSTAIGWYEKAASLNSAEARYRLGVVYQRSDPGKAFDYVRAAAQQGHGRAQADLGMAFESGAGTEKSILSAFKWYRESAANGDASGMFHLANCYESGFGVSKDQTRAGENFQKSGQAGYAEAQHAMGRRYALGATSPRDLVAAAAWFQLGAAQGHAPCQSDLGEIYETADGSLRDPAKSLNLYREAAAQGYAEAWFRLARMREQGSATPVNLEDAYHLFLGAAEKGHGDAEDMAKSVARRLPPERVKAIQSRYQASPDKLPGAR